MERTITLRKEYNSLDSILDYLNENSSYKISKEYDHWEIRTDANGQMEPCVFIKKSGMHGAKAFFNSANTLKVSYIIPSKVMHAYFGPSQKARRNVLEIVADNIKAIAMASSQRKAYNEIIGAFDAIMEPK